MLREAADKLGLKHILIRIQMVFNKAGVAGAVLQTALQVEESSLKGTLFAKLGFRV